MEFTKNKIFMIVIMVAAVISLISCYGAPAYLLPAEGDTPKQLLEKARNLYEEGYRKKSIEVYTLIIDEYKAVADRSLIAWAYYEKGFLLFNGREWEESLKCFEEVINNYERDNPSAALLAYEFCKRINYAIETGDYEIFKHGSSYAIPDGYQPEISKKEETSKNGENSESNQPSENGSNSVKNEDSNNSNNANNSNDDTNNDNDEEKDENSSNDNDEKEDENNTDDGNTYKEGENGNGTEGIK